MTAVLHPCTELYDCLDYPAPFDSALLVAFLGTAECDASAWPLVSDAMGTSGAELCQMTNAELELLECVELEAPQRQAEGVREQRAHMLTVLLGTPNHAIRPARACRAGAARPAPLQLVDR